MGSSRIVPPPPKVEGYFNVNRLSCNSSTPCSVLWRACQLIRRFVRFTGGEGRYRCALTSVFLLWSTIGYTDVPGNGFATISCLWLPACVDETGRGIVVAVQDVLAQSRREGVQSHDQSFNNQYCFLNLTDCCNLVWDFEIHAWRFYLIHK